MLRDIYLINKFLRIGDLQSLIRILLILEKHFPIVTKLLVILRLEITSEIQETEYNPHGNIVTFIYRNAK